MSASIGKRAWWAGALSSMSLVWTLASWGAQPSDTSAPFLQWARKSAVPLSTLKPGAPWHDLEPVGTMIGDAPLVAVTEGSHGVAEPLDFRNRLLQYLVEKKGFTAIAIESGLVEGRLVHDYVRAGAGELRNVISQGLSWTFDKLPQNEALIRWLREYNADTRHKQKINFYGFDVPGSPGNPKANRNVDTAVREALQYLARVDRDAAGALRARLDPLLSNLHYDLTKPEGPNYAKFSSAERDALTAGIADINALFERKEASYIAASSASDYEWAHRAAIGASQVDQWLRETPLGNKQADLQTRLKAGSSDSRDRAQADNIDWVARREGPSGKVLVFVHEGHLTAVPMLVKWVPTAAARGRAAQPFTLERVVAGTYLRRRHGDQLVIIGNLIGKGSAACADYKETLSPAPATSSAGFMGAVGIPRYLLDLRSAPAPVAAWLDKPRPLGIGWGPHADYDRTSELQLRRAFDVILYFDTVTPACPN